MKTHNAISKHYRDTKIQILTWKFKHDNHYRAHTLPTLFQALLTATRSTRTHQHTVFVDFMSRPLKHTSSKDKLLHTLIILSSQVCECQHLTAEAPNLPWHLAVLLLELDGRVNGGSCDCPGRRRHQIYPYPLVIAGCDGRPKRPNRVHRPPARWPDPNMSTVRIMPRVTINRDSRRLGATNPATRMLSMTVAPTAIPANSPTCVKQHCVGN